MYVRQSPRTRGVTAALRCLLVLVALLSGCAHLLVPEGKCPVTPRAGVSSSELPDMGTAECRMMCLQQTGLVGACQSYGPPPVKQTVFQVHTPMRSSREPVTPRAITGLR